MHKQLLNVTNKLIMLIWLSGQGLPTGENSLDGVQISLELLLNIKRGGWQNAAGLVADLRGGFALSQLIKQRSALIC